MDHKSRRPNGSIHVNQEQESQAFWDVNLISIQENELAFTNLAKTRTMAKITHYRPIGKSLFPRMCSKTNNNKPMEYIKVQPHPNPKVNLRHFSYKLGLWPIGNQNEDELFTSYILCPVGETIKGST